MALRLFFIISCVFSMLFCEARANEHTDHAKHYVEFDQLLVTKNGMFYVADNGECVPISNISYDEDGYYISAQTYCPRGHILCFRCQSGCRVSMCPYQCNCSW